MRQRGRHLAHRGQSGHMNELRLQLLQPRLRLLTLRYVPDKASEKVTVARSHFPHRQLHREGRAVLALADHDAPDSNDSPLSGPQILLDVAIVILPVGRRHQHLDVFSNHFRRGIAEQPFRRRAERLHDSVLADDDHRIRHGIEDRREMSLARKRVSRAGRGLNPVVLQLLSAPITANRAASTTSDIETPGEIVTKKPSTRLKAVARSPGPSPPRPPATKTAGTKSRRGAASPRIGVSASLARNAIATATGATA